MKIRSAVPENGCLIFFADGKKQKKTKTKQKKTSVKHIHYRLIGGGINQTLAIVPRTQKRTRLLDVWQTSRRSFSHHCDVGVGNITNITLALAVR